jgi:hypothetical protein
MLWLYVWIVPGAFDQLKFGELAVPAYFLGGRLSQQPSQLKVAS